MAAAIYDQRPCESLNIVIDQQTSMLINANEAMESLSRSFSEWWGNHNLVQYISSVETISTRLPIIRVPIPSKSSPSYVSRRHSPTGFIHSGDVFTMPICQLPSRQPRLSVQSSTRGRENEIRNVPSETSCLSICVLIAL